MAQRFSKDELFRLRNHIPINDVIVRVLDLPSKTRDGYLRFLCPICSEFMTACNPTTNLARCFRCERNFNPIDMVMVVKGLNFREAVIFFAGHETKVREVEIMLKKQIQNYLEWMKAEEYAQGTIVRSSRVLKRLLDFMVLNQIPWERTFSCDTLMAFHDYIQVKYAGFVLRGFMRYLHQKGLICLPPDALPKGRGRCKLKKGKLPPIYEEYIHYYQRTRQAGHIQILRIIATLSALNAYLQKHGIRLEDLDVFHMDWKKTAIIAPEPEDTDWLPLNPWLE